MPVGELRNAYSSGSRARGTSCKGNESDSAPPATRLTSIVRFSTIRKACWAAALPFLTLAVIWCDVQLVRRLRDEWRAQDSLRRAIPGAREPSNVGSLVGYPASNGERVVAEAAQNSEAQYLIAVVHSERLRQDVHFWKSMSGTLGMNAGHLILASDDSDICDRSRQYRDPATALTVSCYLPFVAGRALAYSDARGEFILSNSFGEIQDRLPWPQTAKDIETVQDRLEAGQLQEGAQ